MNLDAESHAAEGVLTGHAVPHVMTAAEMLGDSAPTNRPNPESFQLGMVVQHPEFGLGKIMALSGKGNKRSASIQFFTLSRQKRFVLMHSELQPVSSRSQ